MTRKEIDKAFKKARFCTGTGYKQEYNWAYVFLEFTEKERTAGSHIHQNDIEVLWKFRHKSMLWYSIK